MADLFFYYFVQQIFQFQENQTHLDSALVDVFNRFIESKNIFFKFKKLPQFFDFERWYLNKNGRPFLASEITLNVTAPLEKGELFTQRISSALCKIRDQFIINSINDALNKYNSILVIYGGSHWSTQKRSFQEALGKPQFFNFYGS